MDDDLISSGRNTTYSTDHFTIEDWFTKIKNSEIVLPKFQRFEAWGPSQKTELLQSVIEGVPIGSLLLLEKGSSLNFEWRPIEGAEGNENKIHLYLLDGQQRLTTLWRSFNANYEWDVFFVQIEPGKNTEADDLPLVIRKKRYTKEGKDKIYPLWTFKPEEIHKKGLIPLKALNPLKKSAGKDWVKKVARDKSHRHELYDKGLDDIVDNLQHSIAGFSIPHIALGAPTDPDMVLTTFTRVNEQGTKLSTFDLMVAQMASSGVDLHDKVKELRKEVPKLKKFLDVDDLDFLRAAVLLKDKKPTQSNILEIDHEFLLSNWDSLVKGCKRALSFLKEEGIFDKKRLPSETVVPFLFALWAKEIPEGGRDEGEAREALKKYLWRAFFSDHFEKGSTNTLITRDYRSMKSFFRGEGKLTEVPCFEADLPTKEDLIEAGWPKNKNRLARAILAITLRNGALDIYSDKRILPENISNREYHHLFPKDHLSDDYEPNKALNVALITPKTNKEISAQNPKNYLLRITGKTGIEENKLRERLKSHLIPYKSFLAEDYEGFLEKRAELIHAKMKDLV